MPMGCDLTRWTPRGTDGTLGELSPILQSLAPVQAARHGDHQPRAAERVSRHARHFERRLPQRGQGEAHRELRLLSRHHGRSDRRAANRPGDASCRRSSCRWICSRPSGQCDNGYACVYQNNLSWSSPTTPLPAEAHPRIVFERLFGEGGSLAERRAALRKRASLLDWSRTTSRACSGQLGPADQAKVERVSRHRARSGAPHPEGRGRRRDSAVAAISIGRSACRPRTPTTRG